MSRHATFVALMSADHLKTAELNDLKRRERELKVSLQEDEALTSEQRSTLEAERTGIRKRISAHYRYVGHEV